MLKAKRFQINLSFVSNVSNFFYSSWVNHSFCYLFLLNFLQKEKSELFVKWLKPIKNHYEVLESRTLLNRNEYSEHWTCSFHLYVLILNLIDIALCSTVVDCWQPQNQIFWFYCQLSSVFFSFGNGISLEYAKWLQAIILAHITCPVYESLDSYSTISINAIEICSIRFQRSDKFLFISSFVCSIQSSFSHLTNETNFWRKLYNKYTEHQISLLTYQMIVEQCFSPSLISMACVCLIDFQRLLDF